MEQDFAWKSSRLTPFMGHIAFLLYDCGEESSPKRGKGAGPRYFVSLSVNEHLVALPGLPLYCPYTTFWQQFSDPLKTSLEDICLRYSEKDLRFPHISNEEPSPDRMLRSESSYAFPELYVIVVFATGIAAGVLGRNITQRCSWHGIMTSRRRPRV